jgi:hypothetical protein
MADPVVTQHTAIRIFTAVKASNLTSIKSSAENQDLMFCMCLKTRIGSYPALFEKLYFVVSTVGIVTGCGLDNEGVRVLSCSRD